MEIRSRRSADIAPAGGEVAKRETSVEHGGVGSIGSINYLPVMLNSTQRATLGNRMMTSLSAYRSFTTMLTVRPQIHQTVQVKITFTGMRRTNEATLVDGVSVDGREVTLYLFDDGSLAALIPA